MRTLIVDDEAPARARMRRLLERVAGVTVAGEAASGTEAVERIAELAPDLVLLDIQMPGLDGFGVIERVGVERMPPVIFVTAYDEHALRAFEVHALDYLLKPVQQQRLEDSLARVGSLIAGRSTAARHEERGQRSAASQEAREGAAEEQEPMPAAEPNESGAAPVDVRLHALLESLGRTRALRHLLVQANERAYLLPVEQLVRAAAERNYVRLYAKGTSYLMRGTIGGLAERLDPGQFLQLGRSDLVRVEAIREMHPWSHGDYHVILHDGTRLVWSRRYRARAAGRFGDG